MELDSYYDGVHGWSGAGSQVTPLIEPGGSFTVRFTPPRTGTFIYHTHLHDDRQLTSGLYGAMLVLDPGETFDPNTDHVVVIGRVGVRERRRLPCSTAAASRSSRGRAAAQHRLRFVNITPGDIFVVSLATADGPVTWRPLTKDGAPVPPGLSMLQPASQKIAVGETYDFEYHGARRAPGAVDQRENTGRAVGSAGSRLGQVRKRSPGRWSDRRYVVELAEG